MREDEPTLPSLRKYAPRKSEKPGDSGVSVRWPEEQGQAVRSNTWPIESRQKGPTSSTNVNPLMHGVSLGVSLGVNAALIIGLLSVLFLGHGGGVLPPSSSTTVSTSTPVLGWLQVSPSSVHFGCNSGQQTQFVVLENMGPDQVQWQAVFSVPANQADVNLAPNQGTLNPGNSASLQIQYQMQGNAQPGVAGQQRAIQFYPDTPDAGSAPSLTYTTVACT